MIKNIPVGLAHVAVPTDDAAATREFYHNIGFEDLVDQDVRGMLKLGSCVIEYYPRRGDELPMGAVSHIALDCPDLDAAYEEIKAMGVTFVTNGIESNQMFAPRTNRFFLFLGPNGERIEFCHVD